MWTFLERLGFRRVDDWSDAGFGDIIGGLKYQYYQSTHWRLAVSGTVRFPTGRWDDPNNLVDSPTGFEAWGLGLQAHQDFVSVLPTSPRASRCSLVYSHPYERHPMTWRPSCRSRPQCTRNITWTN